MTSGETGLVSDREIMAESSNSPERFSVVVDAYGEIIYRYLARRAGASVGEDLAAETFLRAFRARADYRGLHPSALPWLYGIATNLLRDHARSERRQTEALARLAGRAVLEGGGGEERVDDALTAATTLRRVAVAIAALGPDARDVLVLVAVEGLSYQDASIALGVPDGTVRSRLSRARLELRRSLLSPPPSAVADVPAAECEKGASRD